MKYDPCIPSRREDPFIVQYDVCRGTLVYIDKKKISGWREDPYTELLVHIMEDGTEHMVADRDDEWGDFIFPPISRRSY